MQPEVDSKTVARYARMLKALGTEPRLRLVRLLLSAHPLGMTASELAAQLGVPNSTLSHYLDELKRNDLVAVRRQGTFLWYTANDQLLQQLFRFLYEECCRGGRAACCEEDTVAQRRGGRVRIET
jgi:ArsR family transcriptional regulator